MMNSKDFSAMICTYVVGMVAVILTICLFGIFVDLFCN